MEIIAYTGRECANIIKAKGIQPVELFGLCPTVENVSFETKEELDAVITYWSNIYNAFRNQKASMIQDLEKGRKCEIYQINGKFVDEAKKLVFVDRVLYGYFTENTGSITAIFSRKRLQWLEAQEERIRFFDEHGYTGLMPSAYRKLCDACITFYFRCTDNVEEAAALKKELKDRLKAYEQQGAEWIEKLPARTRMGYKLFEICPAIYGKLLSRMQEAG